MISLKKGVRFAHAQQPLSVIVLVVERAFAAFGYDTVITSGSDGMHRPGSLHRSGLALDFRTKHVKAEHKDSIVQLAVKSLPQCDVLLENIGMPEEHMHVEWDPKAGE